jgi:hypothetical protein
LTQAALQDPQGTLSYLLATLHGSLGQYAIGIGSRRFQALAGGTADRETRVLQFNHRLME